ncbi:Spore germination protein A3 precursor [Caloramator mitchellensis]|uniref:Spore germination protein A3 n=1 Tax=Caloramator mitchellensis TaxID=908809 RepID=A0A0R3JWG4_CALMK|nr:Ger(x)C family spore germination protein [Caloramator mitchellensis]KRQ87910.1 Spore germination protein A3 precursor [Caloramator mitchellensis]
MKKINLLLIIIPFLFTGCYDRAPIERTSITVGIGQDLADNETLSASFEFLVFQQGDLTSKEVITTTGKSIFEMYNKRLLITKRRHLPGTIRLLIISEKRAKFGIEDIIDVFLRDQERELNTTVVVSKQKTEEILNLKSKDATTMSEEIEDLARSSFEANFTQRDTNIKDFFNMYFQDGRRIMIPYIEKYKDTVKISGIAVFEKDKMLLVIPEEDAKYVNLLRNDNSKGYLSFPKETSKSFDLFCSSRRKVKVDIEDDKVNYTIHVLIYASIKEENSDEFDELSKEQVEELQTKYSNKLKEQLEEVIKKYQSNYGIDIYDLQKYALAKLGKDKADEVEKQFQNSNINVEVKIKFLSTGRLFR